jgi:group I intron endonuclease
MGIVYKATNTKTGMIYIGQTWRALRVRILEHIKPSNSGKTHFAKALAKYGIDAFDWETVFESDDKDSLDVVEKNFIEKYSNEMPGILYNIASGGQNNVNIWHMPGHREFIANAQRMAWTEERKREFATTKNPSARKIMCLETGEVFNCAMDAVRKYNISAASISMCCHAHDTKKYNRQTAGDKHWIFYERDLSENERQEIISEIGVFDGAGNKNPNARPVKNVCTGTVYLSMADAAKSVAGNPDCMKAAINRGAKYKGFHWEQIKK